MVFDGHSFVRSLYCIVARDASPVHSNSNDPPCVHSSAWPLTLKLTGWALLSCKHTWAQLLMGKWESRGLAQGLLESRGGSDPAGAWIRVWDSMGEGLASVGLTLVSRNDPNPGA